MADRKEAARSTQTECETLRRRLRLAPTMQAPERHFLR